MEYVPYSKTLNLPMMDGIFYLNNERRARRQLLGAVLQSDTGTNVYTSRLRGDVDNIPCMMDGPGGSWMVLRTITTVTHLK